jgi:inorganic pyrophosphatase
MKDLTHLPCRSASSGTAGTNGAFNVVVEAPRGASVKVKYEPSLMAFLFSRALLLGTVYPYDWGFFPSTRAEDGDPLDAIVLHEGRTWPGIVIPVFPIGVVRVVQREKKKKTVRNDRIVAVPASDPRYAHVRELPDRVIQELEEFFVAVSRLTEKHVIVQGWEGPKAARSVVRRAISAFAHDASDEGG